MCTTWRQTALSREGEYSTMKHLWLSPLWVSPLICSRRLPFQRRHAETGITRKAVCLRLKALRRSARQSGESKKITIKLHLGIGHSTITRKKETPRAPRRPRAKNFRFYARFLQMCSRLCRHWLSLVARRRGVPCAHPEHDG